MRFWLFGGLLLVGYFAIGVLAAHIAAWLHRARHVWIRPSDWQDTMIALLLCWPVIVPVWAAVKLISVVLPGPSERR